MLPYHLVSRHIEHVHLGYSPEGANYISGYVIKKAKDIDFCLCLTCNKGTCNDGYSANSARWATLHSNQQGCTSAHPAALNALKQRLATVQQAAALHSPTPQISDPFDTLWEDCRSKKYLQNTINDLERRMKEDYDDNSDNEDDYTLQPKVGFQLALERYMSVTKEVEILKAKLHEVEQKHERELFVLRQELTSVKQQCSNIQHSFTQLSHEHEELSMKYDILQSQITENH